MEKGFRPDEDEAESTPDEDDTIWVDVLTYRLQQKIARIERHRQHVAKEIRGLESFLK